ncbi:MAG: S-adenosylmethionine:tRNA ribosyltransferase-isomerase, partial [Coriobacteriia bacterium]|nr:S-adenosylmethionine:tRNA ribosyltransferase-isomerase [Coriobacteriia bacterium]
MHPDLSSSRNFGGQFCSYIPGKDYRSLPYLTADFDYDLPDERIAQEPVTPRDSCKLLVLDRATGQTHHTLFTRIIDHLNPEDLLIVNDTRVLPARLMMRKANTHGAVEVLLLEQIEAIDPRTELWKCLVRPGKSARVGSALEFVGSDDLALAGCIRGVIAEGTRI